MTSRVSILVLSIAAGLLGSCGYSSGIRLADRMRSVGVPFFGNQTLERDVERPMQDALTTAIRSLTDVPIREPATAEVVLRGVILEYHRRGGIRSSDNQLLETGLFVQVEGGLYDCASGRPLGPQRRAQVWIGYVVDDPNAATNAQDRAIRNVAEELVLDLFSPLD